MPTTKKTITWLLRAIPIVCMIGVPAYWLHAQTTTVNTADIQPVALSADPLYAQGAGQKPTLTLALSVEFPTVGAAYRDNYNQTNNYVGYFDSNSCYTYNKANDYFERYGNASDRGCAGAGFSGNFMNWANSSAIDILRLGLTGGDRITDTTSLTILQRAVIPKNFYNSGSYFPSKTLPAAAVSASVPRSLITKGDGTTHSGDIKIANCLNRIYFGTESSGDCDSPGNNSNLGNTSGRIGSINKSEINTRITLSNYSHAVCDDGSACNFSGVRKVYFGRQSDKDGKNSYAYWHWAYVKDGFNCNWSESSMGDPNPGQTKKCYVSNATYDSQVTTNSLSNNSYFLTRVKVCESSSGTLSDPRSSLCQRYANGSFKPVGNMQKYSDRIRVAAFGYLMDNTNDRYGGVLRAPMTYVGPRAYDANGLALTGNNPNQEWDSTTGIFTANPRQDNTYSRSGVINYLNTFGRMPDYEGVYKTLDPVSELYYESLRYLQGLQPTPQAVSNLTASNRAGYPVYSQWTDPFEGGSNTQSYACLRNSILLIGDVNTHNDKSLPGNTTTSGSGDFDRSSEVNLANNIPNFKEWTKIIGGFESNNRVRYLDGAGTERNTSNPSVSSVGSDLWGLEAKGTGSGGSSAYYMAGAAYWAHTHDIRGTQWTNEAKRRPGLRVTTYVLDVNENGAQNTASNRWKSQFFLTAKYGGFTDIDGDGNPFTPSSTSDPNGTRHWAKSTATTEAKTYFLASDAQAVLQALDDIFIAATQASSSIAKPALSSSRLTSADSYVYQADFDPEYWSGDIKRRTLTLNTNNAISLSSEATAVSAARQLDNLSATGLSSRNIVVGKTGTITNSYATSFTWANIESSLQTHLNRTDSAAQADNLGQQRLNFLRGDRSLEGTTFRVRGSRLGDIVNSGVVYSGAPSTRYTEAAYQTFYTNNKNRTKAIFVGANDGMLHAFNASTMEEIFAYIPSWMGPKLSTLTVSDYNSSRHTSFVDATPVVAEAKLGNDWKTVLVSGTGGGGQGVFALDVTNPSEFGTSKVLWEFTDAHDASLGNVVGQPKILKLRTSAPDATTATYKWFAVFASGVNNYVEDGANRFSSTGEPAIFLLDLSKRTDANWSLGENYFKITVPIIRSSASGTIVSNNTAKASGIINFEATGNPDGSVQYLYFGDLHGQFWKLDMGKANLSSSTAENWNLNKLSYFKNSRNEARPLFIAKSSNGHVQPISMVPSIAYGPLGSYLIAFGTGKYQEASDNAISSSTQVQSFYVLYDLPDTALDTEGNARINGRSRLQQASISDTSITASGFQWSAPRDATSSGVIKKSGWFIDYPNGGSSGAEQQITNAVLFGQDIIFNSLLPPTASGSACGGGASRTYTANLASGLGTVSTLSTGALGAPMLLNLTSSYGATGAAGERFRTDRVGILNPSATGLGDSASSISTRSADFPVGRLSWRQINNYQELKNRSWE